MQKTRGTKTRTNWLFGTAAAAALLFSASRLALAATVSFNPSTNNVLLGETFDVDIVGSGFTELSGGVINLGFSDSLLQINSISIDPFFDFASDGGGPAVGDEWPGIGFDIFVNDPATGDFTIATINLTTLAQGAAELVVLNTSEFFSKSAQLDPVLETGAINVSSTVVPVPGAMWLFGSGLLGLVGVAIRKKPM